MATQPIKLPSILASLAAPGANAGDVQTAKDQMAIQLIPQEAGINNTIQQIQGYLDRDIQAQQQYGIVADQRIADIGQGLATQLQGNVGAIGDIYNQGQTKVGGIYDSGIAATQAAGSSIRNRIEQGAAGLGQTQALKADPYGTDPISRLLANQASAETRLNTSKTSSQANMQQLGTTLQGIAQKAVGDSEHEYANKRSQLAQDVLANISNLQLQGNNAIIGELQKYSTLAAVAGPQFRQLINQAATARTTAAQAAANQALDNLYKMAKINKLNQADDPNSLDNIIKQLTITDKGLTIQGKQIDLDAKQNPVNYLSDVEGNQNLMNWLNANVRADRKSPGLSGTEHAGIQNFINQNLALASTSGLYNTTDPVKILAGIAQQNIDSKTGKVKLPISAGSKYKQSDYETDFQTLLEALNARFYHVGTSAKAGTKIK